jgi:sugar/nucleoside kinase (ribokinase family)
VTSTPARAIQVTVVGTLAFDDVATPAGEARGVLGGSASYFSVAASLFARVGLVGVVGADFPRAHRDLLAARDIDLAGLETARGGRTFHWAGRYDGAMNAATTLATDLNVLATFAPALRDAQRSAPYVFLANIAPKTQLAVLDALPPRPEGAPTRLVVADTMNYWIASERDALVEVLRRVDGLTVNDDEARVLSGERNLIAAGKRLVDLGPRFAIVKKGEHGAFLFAKDRLFAIPAYPLGRIVDPTGAGDSFAGGVMGALAASGGRTTADVARAMVYGTVAASFAVSSFSLDALAKATRDDVEARAEELRRFVSLPERSARG